MKLNILFWTLHYFYLCLIGVYSVSIEVQKGGQEGIAKVAGEVDPNILLREIARSGEHAELLNVRIRDPRLRNRYSDDNYNYYNYGSNRYNSLGYGRSGSFPASAYYEVDQDYYPYGRRSLVEYPYSYSDNYRPLPPAIHVPSYPPYYERRSLVEYPYFYSDNYRPLPPAIHVPSYPPQYQSYNDHDPISFCSIM